MSNYVNMDHCMKLLYLAMPAYGLYAVCSSLYDTCRRGKCVVFESRRSLPCYLYLYVRYKFQAFRKRRGQLYPVGDKNVNPTFTILNCRLREDELRWYCLAAGYGWDYPDSVFRDVPLAFCHVLCCRLLAMITSSSDFRICPQGLVHVRQTLMKYEPIDELKKAPFRLQAGVTEYRPVDGGVEVDICFKALRMEQPIWESAVTMLSPRKGPVPHDQPCTTGLDATSKRVTLNGATDMKSVTVKVPLLAGLRAAWAFCDVSLKNLLVLPSRLAIVGLTSSHGLWMLSQCLAEIEKHKGPDAVRPPLRVSVQFGHPLVLPRREAAIRFWAANGREDVDGREATNVAYRFQLHDEARGICHLMGEMLGESG